MGSWKKHIKIVYLFDRVGIHENLDRQGFTLIELLIVIAIFGVLAIIVIVLIDPLEKLARARDAGRIFAVAQLGHAVESYYTATDNSYPDSLSWDLKLVATGTPQSFPSGIPYRLAGVSPCTTNVRPTTDPTYCYDVDTSGNGYGAIVFSTLEAQIHRNKCALTEIAYFVYSTADGHGGTICRSSDPTPWAAGSATYVD